MTLKAAPLATASANVPAAPKVDERVKTLQAARILADLMQKGIKKQLKWAPPILQAFSSMLLIQFNGTISMVPSETMLYALFDLKEETKEWKQKKIPSDEFTAITGGLSVSIRYGYLQVNSPHIILKYDRAASTFTVSGSYGV